MHRFLTMVLLLVAVSSATVPAQAQEQFSGKYCQTILDEEFVRAGDTVHSAGYPMTPQEHRIFKKVQEYLVRYNASHADDPDRMPGVSINSVLSVKFGRNFAKKWSVLLNLKSDVLPRTESRGDDPFYAGLGTAVAEIIMKEFPRKLAEDDPCSDNGPAVFEVFEMKTQEPDEYRTEEWLKAHHKQRQGTLDAKNCGDWRATSSSIQAMGGI